MVYDYKISDEILEKFSNNKFLKKDMKLVIKETMKSFGMKKIRGSKQVDVIGKIIDGGYIIYEIGLFDGLFGYWILLFDDKGNIIYDEADGEIKNKNKLYSYYNNINSIDVKDGSIENIRLKLFYPYMV